jgi:hypothetical protein
VADEGRADLVWDTLALDESEVERGLADGSLVADVRLRDVLRELGAGRSSRRTGGRAPHDASAHALDVAVFEEAELVRFRRWTDELERRVVLLDGRRR